MCSGVLGVGTFSLALGYCAFCAVEMLCFGYWLGGLCRELCLDGGLLLCLALQILLIPQLIFKLVLSLVDPLILPLNLELQRPDQVLLDSLCLFIMTLKLTNFRHLLVIPLLHDCNFHFLQLNLPLNILLLLLEEFPHRENGLLLSLYLIFQLLLLQSILSYLQLQPVTVR